MTNRRPLWSQCVIASHLVVVVLAGYALALTRSDLLARGSVAHLGHEPFRSEHLVHEASHYNLARRRGSMTCSGTWRAPCSRRRFPHTGRST